LDEPGLIVENEEWHKLLIEPIRQALYANIRPDAKRAHQNALVRVPDLGLSDDVQEAIHYVLMWYGFVISIQGQPLDYCRQRFAEVAAKFSHEAESDYGDLQRRRTLTVLRCTGRLYGLDDMSRPELDELISGMPGVDEDEFLWHNIAGWAFAVGEADLLEKAYEVLLTRPSNLLGSAKWQRVNMMLQLVNGKATRKDIKESLKEMVVLPQVLEFRRQIWPVCIEKGLVDAELEAELEAVINRIRTNPPIPKAERRTKKIRN